MKYLQKRPKDTSSMRRPVSHKAFEIAMQFLKKYNQGTQKEQIWSDKCHLVTGI